MNTPDFALSYDPDAAYRPRSATATNSDERRATDGRSLDRLALWLDRTPADITRDVPAAMLEVLCRLPSTRRLRRGQDRALLADLRALLADIPDDDLRRRRLAYLLEEAERRSRL